MKSLVSILKGGGIAVVKTDTLYGLVAKATHIDAVNNIYSIKKRDTQKPLIVLISHIDNLHNFGVKVDADLRLVLGACWPGPTSIILPVGSKSEFTHIHRGQGSIAFRLPDNDRLRDLIDEVGPLCAPSANPEGLTPATDISMARAYFGDQVAYYDDRGVCTVLKPSRLIRVDKNGKITELRK